MVRNEQNVSLLDGSREHHGAAEPFLFTSESVGEGHPEYPLAQNCRALGHREVDEKSIGEILQIHARRPIKKKMRNLKEKLVDFIQQEKNQL